ncbi:coagulation factor IX-like [Parasteatoda tepidariorum]|uniref:coagulation factor IX-like n=1 Tax=Parasteatoda tepidariorum TaxID=114398 RepID=UPI001C7279D7|nr:coagulation factor IX-like [Parasteatoda tepidariorum]
MINGIVAKPKQFPFVVDLHIGTNSCSGLLITPKTVITAGHCLRINDTVMYKVYMGNIKKQIKNKLMEKTVQLQNVSKIILHPKFENLEVISDGINSYDIGIIILKNPFKMTPSVKTICLKNKKRPYPKKAISIGFGQTEHYNKTLDGGYLRYFEVDILNPIVCAVIFRAIGLAITRKEICASFTRAGAMCSGDSGGPLVSEIGGKYVALAIVSQGTLTQCNQPLLAQAYTKINPFENWIQKQIGNEYNICFV